MPIEQSGIKEIDLDEIIQSRIGKKAKYIPRFVVTWLKKFVQQDFVNVFLRKGFEGVEFCREGVKYLGADVTVEGKENLPDDGRYHTFVSNHPLGAIDGVALGWIVGEHYEGKIKYLVNDLLMNLQGLAPLCIPINKIGRQSRNLPAMVESAFSGKNHVLMFPAGLCSRKRSDGTIRDLPWGKTFIIRSVKHQRDVVPIHFVGRNSNRFYRVAMWCKRLHLPNFAMLLLPNEMRRSNGSHYMVRIGKPIPYQTFDHSRTPAEWAQWVQDRVYEL